MTARSSARRATVDKTSAWPVVTASHGSAPARRPMLVGGGQLAAVEDQRHVLAEGPDVFLAELREIQGIIPCGDMAPQSIILGAAGRAGRPVDRSARRVSMRACGRTIPAP